MLHTLLSSLRIEPRLLLFNGILFLVLVQVMSRLFWKPVMAQLQQRKDAVAAAYRTVDETRAEMEASRAQYQARLDQLGVEARLHIQTTINEAQREREQILNSAKHDADALLHASAAALNGEIRASAAGLGLGMQRLAVGAVAKTTGMPVDDNTRTLVREHMEQVARNN